MNPLETLAAEIPHLQQSLDSAYVLGSSPLGMTQYVLWMFICLGITAAIVLTAAKRLTLIPGGSKFVSIVEFGYNFIRKDVGEVTIGHGYKKHVPFLATIFLFILISNFAGLVPGGKAPTGAISITWALSLIAFVYFNYWGFKTHGGLGYIKSIAPSGLPIFLAPVIWLFEFISLVLRLLTLAVRLYGNIFAGHMVIGIFALATTLFLGAAIQNMDFVAALPSIAWFAFLLAMYVLKMLVSFLQAYVFAILTAVYISLATSEH